MHLVLASISVYIYLENLDHHFLVVGNVDCFKHFTVLATPKFSHQLKVILVSGKRGGEKNISLDEVLACCECLHEGQRGYLPPLNYVRLVVPVLPGPMSVDLGVHSGPAWHGS